IPALSAGAWPTIVAVDDPAGDAPRGDAVIRPMTLPVVRRIPPTPVVHPGKEAWLARIDRLGAAPANRDLECVKADRDVDLVDVHCRPAVIVDEVGTPVCVNDDPVILAIAGEP